MYVVDEVTVRKAKGKELTLCAQNVRKDFMVYAFLDISVCPDARVQ